MSHDKPPTAEAEGPLYASAPQLVLLGLPKAGTTSVFSCLTSGAFRNPAPCCANNEKEPQFFSYNLGKLKELQLKNGTYTRRPGVLLLDFSTIYLAEAFWSIPRLSAVYASAAAKRALRFVLFLRDPTERALSNFCMTRFQRHESPSTSAFLVVFALRAAAAGKRHRRATGNSLPGTADGSRWRPQPHGPRLRCQERPTLCRARPSPQYAPALD